MDCIANKVGISKRTLYENFKDKEDLLIQCVDYIEEEGQESTRVLIGKCSNSMEILLVVYKEVLTKIRFTNRNYHSDLQRYHPNVLQRYDKRKEKDIQNMINLLNAGIEEGYIRKDLKTDIVPLLLDAQFELLTKTDNVITNRFSFSDVFETIFMNFIRGIATPRGLEYIDSFIEKRFKKEEKIKQKTE